MLISLDIVNPDSDGDLSFLDKFIRSNGPAGIEGMFVFGKTTGHADLEDRSRHIAQAETTRLIQEIGGEQLSNRSWSIFSTGCEGVASPILVGMATRKHAFQADGGGQVGMMVGAARSAPIADGERCTRAHVSIAADCVAEAMQMAGLTPAQVLLVLVKSPVRFSREGTGGKHAFSTGAARGAAALGSGIALGDVDPGSLSDAPVLASPAYATRTMAFSGTENDHIEAIVFGRRDGGDPRWTITYAEMSDFMDVETLKSIERPAGYEPTLVFYKAGIPADGRLRGRPTTVLNSELPPDKQLRSASSGLLAAIFGSMNTFISGGAEHQGRDGSCFCAVLWQRVDA